MKKFGLLIPKYIFVQYQYVLLTKFGIIIPKYIFVFCVYLLLTAVLILMQIYLLLQSEYAPPFLSPFHHMCDDVSARKQTAVANRSKGAC